MMDLVADNLENYPPTDQRDQQLDPKERTWAGVGAGILMALGGASTFVSSNEIGSASLVLMGGALAVLAVTGQRLRRVKIGEHEADFYSDAGREVLETAKSETRNRSERDAAREILERAREKSPAVPSQVVSLTLAHQYEEEVFAALRRVASTQISWKQSSVDAVVDGKIGVDVKYRSAGRAPGRNAVSPAGSYRPLIDASASDGLSALLIITNSAVAETSFDEGDGSVAEVPIPVRLLQWTTGMGDEVLRDALHGLSEAKRLS